jgi:ABC-type amino acid transport substrate-binding protein
MLEMAFGVYGIVSVVDSVLDVKVNAPGLYVGFSRKRNADQLAKAFNPGLATIRRDGTYARIIRRYTQP